jgi:hypothetical protein
MRECASVDGVMPEWVPVVYAAMRGHQRALGAGGWLGAWHNLRLLHLELTVFSATLHYKRLMFR